NNSVSNIFKQLKSNNPNYTLFDKACQNSYFDVDLQLPDGAPLLHNFICTDEPHAVVWLLLKGADRFAKTIELKTALDLAKEYHNGKHYDLLRWFDSLSSKFRYCVQQVAPQVPKADTEYNRALHTICMKTI